MNGLFLVRPERSSVPYDRGGAPMEMLCCSPRSASSLLERAGLFPRTDEEYELRVIVWEARAVATEPPKARLPQWTQRSAPPSSTRLRPMYCV